MTEPQTNEPTLPVLPELDTKEQNKWWWDPPKLIPIIISVVALIFAGLSWRESYKGRKINEEVNRPILGLVSIKTSQRAGDTEEIEPEIHLSVGAKIINVGKSTAIIEKAYVSANLLSDVEELCYASEMEERADSYKGTNLIPHMQETFSRNLNVMQSCKELSVWLFQVRLELEYTDAVSGNKYNQSFVEFVSMTPEDVLNEGRKKDEEDKKHQSNKRGR